MAFAKIPGQATPTSSTHNSNPSGALLHLLGRALHVCTHVLTYSHDSPRIGLLDHVPYVSICGEAFHLPSDAQALPHLVWNTHPHSSIPV